MWLRRGVHGALGARVRHQLELLAFAQLRPLSTDRPVAPPPPQIINPFASNTSTPPSSLLQVLTRQIQFTGPLTVHEYMKQALTHPQFGFYMSAGDVFGSRGHFTTSPEVSQIFGELVGIWILYEWLKRGASRPLRIVEFGPGRGTLTADLSRVMSQFSQTAGCTSFHLVEISPRLKRLQEKTICKRLFDDEKQQSQAAEEYQRKGLHSATTYYGQPVTWYQTVEQIPDSGGFTVYLANEFYDALPIYKFAKVDTEWRELLIDIDPASSQPSLRWIKAKHSTPALKLFAGDLSSRPITGDHLELCPQAAVHIASIIERINREDGCLLICDYGHDEAKADSEPINRDTFRAYRSHEPVDPLQAPGTADLTADVDFDYIRRQVGSTAAVYGTVTQEHFLRSLGIEVRLQKLLECTANADYQAELQSGVKMLLEDMGRRFRLMAICRQDCHTVPVAFEE